MKRKLVLALLMGKLAVFEGGGGLKKPYIFHAYLSMICFFFIINYFDGYAYLHIFFPSMHSVMQSNSSITAHAASSDAFFLSFLFMAQGNDLLPQSWISILLSSPWPHYLHGLSQACVLSRITPHYVRKPHRDLSSHAKLSVSEYCLAAGVVSVRRCL